MCYYLIIHVSSCVRLAEQWGSSRQRQGCYLESSSPAVCTLVWCDSASLLTAVPAGPYHPLQTPTSLHTSWEPSWHQASKCWCRELSHERGRIVGRGMFTWRNWRAGATSRWVVMLVFNLLLLEERKLKRSEFAVKWYWQWNYVKLVWWKAIKCIFPQQGKQTPRHPQAAMLFLLLLPFS